MPGDRRQILSLLRLPVPPLQLVLDSNTCHGQRRNGKWVMVNGKWQMEKCNRL